MEIHVFLAGVEFGPYTPEKVRELVADNLLAMSDPARISADQPWAPLHEVLGPTGSDLSRITGSLRIANPPERKLTQTRHLRASSSLPPIPTVATAPPPTTPPPISAPAPAPPEPPALPEPPPPEEPEEAALEENSPVEEDASSRLPLRAPPLSGGAAESLQQPIGQLKPRLRTKPIKLSMTGPLDGPGTGKPTTTSKVAEAIRMLTTGPTKKVEPLLPPEKAFIPPHSPAPAAKKGLRKSELPVVIRSTSKLPLKIEGPSRPPTVGVPAARTSAPLAPPLPESAPVEGPEEKIEPPAAARRPEPKLSGFKLPELTSPLPEFKPPPVTPVGFHTTILKVPESRGPGMRPANFKPSRPQAPGSLAAAPPLPPIEAKTGPLKTPAFKAPELKVPALDIEPPVVPAPEPEAQEEDPAEVENTEFKAPESKPMAPPVPDEPEPEAPTSTMRLEGAGERKLRKAIIPPLRNRAAKSSAAPVLAKTTLIEPPPQTPAVVPVVRESRLLPVAGIKIPAPEAPPVPVARESRPLPPPLETPPAAPPVEARPMPSLAIQVPERPRKVEMPAAFRKATVPLPEARPEQRVELPPPDEAIAPPEPPAEVEETPPAAPPIPVSPAPPIATIPLPAISKPGPRAQTVPGARKALEIKLTSRARPAPRKLDQPARPETTVVPPPLTPAETQKLSRADLAKKSAQAKIAVKRNEESRPLPEVPNVEPVEPTVADLEEPAEPIDAEAAEIPEEVVEPTAKTSFTTIGAPLTKPTGKVVSTRIQPRRKQPWFLVGAGVLALAVIVLVSLPRAAKTKRPSEPLTPVATPAPASRPAPAPVVQTSIPAAPAPVPTPTPMPVVPPHPSGKPFVEDGNEKLKAGQFDAALAAYNHALEVDPKLASAYFGRGNLKAAQNNADGAIGDYTQALQLNPHLSQALYARGLVRQSRGELEGAIADYSGALKEDPKMTLAYYNRGLSREEAGDLDGAIADTDKALELDPTNYQGFYNRGLARLAKGNTDGARADLKGYCLVAPHTPYTDYARLYLWLIQAQNSSLAEANQDLSAALNSGWNGGSGDLVSKLGQFLLGQVGEEDLIAATTAPDAVKDQQQRCEAWYFIGMKRLLASDQLGAIDAFQKCVATQERDFCEFILAQQQLNYLNPHKSSL